MQAFRIYNEDTLRDRDSVASASRPLHRRDLALAVSAGNMALRRFFG